MIGGIYFLKLFTSYETQDGFCLIFDVTLCDGCAFFCVVVFNSTDDASVVCHDCRHGCFVIFCLCHSVTIQLDTQVSEDIDQLSQDLIYQLAIKLVSLKLKKFV